jgi:hypothetical protein
MLFSQRYLRVLEQKKLVVEIPEPARRKLWSWLTVNNTPLRKRVANQRALCQPTNGR